MGMPLEPVLEWWDDLRARLVTILEGFNQKSLDGRCAIVDHDGPTLSKDSFLKIVIAPRMAANVEGFQPEAVELKITIAKNHLSTIAIGAYCPNLSELVRDHLQRVVPWLRWYERNLGATS